MHLSAFLYRPLRPSRTVAKRTTKWLVLHPPTSPSSTSWYVLGIYWKKTDYCVNICLFRRTTHNRPTSMLIQQYHKTATIVLVG